VQAEVLDNTNNIKINNSASNGPVKDEFVTKSSATETNEKTLNNCNDHIESDNNVESSITTTKDIICNSIENDISDTNKTDVEGGCDDSASVAGESS